MFRIIAISVALLSLTMCVFAIPVTKNGIAQAKVVLKEDASAAEKYAADEFVKYIKEISGAELSVSADEAENYNIFIGQSDRAKEIAGIDDWAKISDDEIVIVSKGLDLVISGGKGSGTIYAVYDFLDRLGVKFITCDDEYIPKNKNIVTGPMNIIYKSPFMSRESFFKQFNDNPDYCLKLKMNGHFDKVKPELGGHVELLGWAHTFDLYLSYEKYGTLHPEWYAYRDGKRLNKEYSQLCLSNKDMVKELIKQVLKSLDENPNTKIISVTQNDNQKFCQCQECTELTEKYGHSGALLTVVNQVADAVKEKYPDVLVETFAYNYTRHAPKGDIIPRDNVIIRLCSIEADFGKTFDQPSNEDFYTNIKNWSSITKNLYVWDYIVNFTNYVILHPNFHVLQRNLQIMRDNHAVAVFEQGDSFNSNACFHNYKRYITAKLLWNPNMDLDAETKAFMKAYYGPAGNEMYELLSYINKTATEVPTKIGTYMSDNNYFTAQNWIKMLEYLDKGLKKTKGTKYAERIKMDQICLFAGLLAAERTVSEEVMKSRVSPFKNSGDALKEINSFVPSHGLTYHAESQKWETGFYAISGENEKEGKAPDVCLGLKDEDWYEIQDMDLTPAGLLFETEEYRKLVNVPGASNGKAIKIPCASKEWYIQKKLANLCFDKTLTSGDVYMTAKIAPGINRGKAIEIGVYDTGHKANVFTARLGAEDTPDNQWTTVKLGTIDFSNISAGSYLYVCGMGDEYLSSSVLVDRVFIVLNRD